MGRIRGLVVTRSGIHGYGMFATKKFTRGELITEVEGVLRRENENYDDTYTMDLEPEKGLFWDMVDQSRYANHSCDPTCIMRWPRVNGKYRPRLVARRKISPGDEITWDYAFAYEDRLKCGCGTKQCRGWIIEEDELPRLRRAQRRRRARKNGR